MFSKLKQIFGANDLDKRITAELKDMMTGAGDLVRRAGEAFAGGRMSSEERDAFYAGDREINRMEQKVRRQVISQVTFSSPVHRTRLLAFLSFVKDVERLGDYAKNLIEAAELLPPSLPQPGVPEGLKRIRGDVEAILDETYSVLDNSDEARAWSLLDQGHQVSLRCDALVESLAASSLPAAIAVPSALATRYYKRLTKHLMNLLSSVVMPLDRIGYYDSSQR